MVSKLFAVAMNIIFDKSKGVPKKWSVNFVFWAGSSTSKSAAPGSPR